MHCGQGVTRTKVLQLHPVFNIISMQAYRVAYNTTLAATSRRFNTDYFLLSRTQKNYHLQWVVRGEITN